MVQMWGQIRNSYIQLISIHNMNIGILQNILLVLESSTSDTALTNQLYM